jgi:hypothetical protein
MDSDIAFDRDRIIYVFTKPEFAQQILDGDLSYLQDKFNEYYPRGDGFGDDGWQFKNKRFESYVRVTAYEEPEFISPKEYEEAFGKSYYKDDHDRFNDGDEHTYFIDSFGHWKQYEQSIYMNMHIELRENGMWDLFLISDDIYWQHLIDAWGTKQQYYSSYGCIYFAFPTMTELLAFTDGELSNIPDDFDDYDKEKWAAAAESDMVENYEKVGEDPDEMIDWQAKREERETSYRLNYKLEFESLLKKIKGELL